MNVFRTIHTEDQIPSNDIKKMLDAFVADVSHYEDLQSTYECKNAAILDVEKPANVPNNKIVHPFPRLITDTLTGFFISVPVAYSVEAGADDLLETITEVFDRNDEDNENYSIAKTASIQGLCYELLYTNAAGEPRFKAVPPTDMFIVYDTTIDNNIVAAVRVYNVNMGDTPVQFADVYDKWSVRHYSDEDEFHLINEEPHFWGDVPVAVYLNNAEHIGDFEPCMSMIEAYDKAQSNTLNDMEQFTDAMLKLRGFSGTDSEDVDALRIDKVLLLDEDGDADWLIKNVNDALAENTKTRLQHDIHKFSCTPDTTDENFGGNSSGVALSYKLLAMEQLRATKENHFEAGLTRRLKLLCSLLSITTNISPDDYTKISMQFSDTLPKNVIESAQIVEMLGQYVSRETLLSLLPFIDDPQAEIEKKEAEEMDAADKAMARMMQIKPDDDTKVGGDDGDEQ